MSDLLLRSRRVVLADRVVPATIEIAGGRIQSLREGAPDEVTRPVIDVGDSVVMAGVVDAHVHINEPGRTEWEGFVTATAAAAAGGITTIVDMPLNCIPVTTTREALAVKAREAQGRCSVDYAFWGGVVPGNAGELEGMIDAGVAGFKCFLVHSGIDDFPASTEADLRLAMPIIARKGSVLLVHAELPGPIDAAEAEQRAHPKDPRRYETFLRSRPRASENEAIAMMIRLSRELSCRVHIVHLSSSDALPMLADAKRQGVPISAETCPHYLTFVAEEIPDGATQYKCCPPIRESDNRDRLWEGLRAGILDVVVSDHSPCAPALKVPEKGDFLDAWGGIASLQFGVSSIWTEASRRGFSLPDLSRWMSRSSAALAGLERKGRIEVGCDADLVVWSPERSFSPSLATIRHRHGVTPYLGRSLSGVVEQTYLRGERIFEGAGDRDARKTARGEWVKPTASRGILPRP
jgi:allantoinase